MRDSYVSAMNEILYDMRDPAIRALGMTGDDIRRDLRLIDIPSQKISDGIIGGMSVDTVPRSNTSCTKRGFILSTYEAFCDGLRNSVVGKVFLMFS
jgi:hypothetical protein